MTSPATIAAAPDVRAPARRAALDPLLNWMADRILEQLLAEAATASQTQHHDRSHLHPLQHRPPARDLPR